MSRIFMPLAAGFKVGVALRIAAYRHGWLKTQRLSRPVISVGNLSVGGTGKTPFVAFLAERLMARGWKPGILTRGYGRRKSADLVAIEPGARRPPDPREVGDEPALLARKLPSIPIVVGADRYRSGRLAEDRFNVNVHILDDGFQHLALARDVDIVLLDTTQELSDHSLLPVGKLREPSDSLRRAHFVGLTRSELGGSEPIEETVRRIHSKVGIVHCSTKPENLFDISNETVMTPEAVGGKPVYAFCGIGNPAAFFADLRIWGISVAGQTAFPDHHVYTPAEVGNLILRARQAGAMALITTEKDVLNFPRLAATEIPIYGCVVQTEVRQGEDFIEAVLQHLENAGANA